MVICGHPLELGIVMAIGSEILAKGYLSGCLLAVITMEESERHSSFFLLCQPAACVSRDIHIVTMLEMI